MLVKVATASGFTVQHGAEVVKDVIGGKVVRLGVFGSQRRVGVKEGDDLNIGARLGVIEKAGDVAVIQAGDRQAEGFLCGEGEGQK